MVLYDITLILHDFTEFNLPFISVSLYFVIVTFCNSGGKTVVKLTEETQLILGEVTRQLNLEKLLPTYRYAVSVRWVIPRLSLTSPKSSWGPWEQACFLSCSRQTSKNENRSHEIEFGQSQPFGKSISKKSFVSCLRVCLIIWSCLQLSKGAQSVTGQQSRPSRPCCFWILCQVSLLHRLKKIAWKALQYPVEHFGR